MPQDYSVCLRLVDGSEWSLTCSENPVKEVVSQLAETMNLVSGIKARNDVLVRIDPEQEPSERPVKIRSISQVLIGPISGREFSPDARTKNLLMSGVGNALGYLIQQDHGVLLHAALAEWKGSGVLFAGPGGIGKSTTSRRLPPGWRSLCDDTCLLIEHQKIFYTHPWPTWSRFYYDGETRGTWNVQEYFPVRAVFLLDQSEEACLERINKAEAVVSLVKSNEQIAPLQLQSLTKEQRIALRMKVFDKISKLVRTVPVVRLHLGLDDDFGELLENFLVEEGAG